MMALKGNLNTVDLANIFQMLSLNQCEGTLYIFDGTSRKAIYFGKDGVSMLSKGRPRSDALGRILVRMDKVTPQQLDAALARQSQSGKLLGQILVDDAACMRPDVEEALQIQIREEVCRLFLWKDAHFEFVEGEPDEEFRKEGVQRLTFGVNGVIVEAARRVDEWEWIQRVVPETCEVYAYTGKNVDLKDSVFSEPFAGKVLAAIDGKRSGDEIIEASCVNKFEVCKILAILLESGAIAKVAPEELAKQADAAAAAGDHAAVSKFLLRLVAARGETPELNRRLGEAFEAQRELAKAAHHLGTYAEVRAAAGDAKEAFRVYRRISSFLPTDLAAAERAIEIFAASPQGLEEHAKDVVESGKRLAEMYVELKRAGRAVQVLQRVASLGPDDPDLRDRLVAVYVAGGMNEEAVAEYEAIADAALAAKDYEKAERICRRILAIDKNRADVAARIEQVVAKRRFLRRGIRGFLVVSTVVAAGTYVGCEAVAWFKRHKAEQAQHELEAQDGLQAASAATAPVFAELDALLRELTTKSPDAEQLAKSLKERGPRITAALTRADDVARTAADARARCVGLASEEDAEALVAEIASKSAALKKKAEEIRTSARESAEAHYDEARQMLADGKSTRAALEHLDLAVSIVEECDGRSATEKNLAWIELQSQVRAYVTKFDDVKSNVERKVADGDVETAYDLAVAYLVDKDFPPPDLRAAMPLPIRIVSHPAGARVTLKDGGDTGLVAGPDCVATVSLLSGASFVLDMPGFERAYVNVPAVKDVDGAVVKEKVKRAYDVTLEKALVFRRVSSDGKPVAVAPFASERYAVVPSSRACDVLELPSGRPAASIPLASEHGLRAGGAVVSADGDDVVVLPTAEGALTFYDAATGKQRGTWTEAHGTVTFDLAVSGGDVVAADDHGGLYCVNAARRLKKWGGQALLESGEPTSFSTAPVVADGAAYVGCEDGTVRVVDLADGHETALLARPAADSGRVCAQPSVDRGFVYVASRCGKATRLTKWKAATARAEWSTTVAGETKSAPAPHGGEVFVTLTSGDVVGVSAADGRPTRSAQGARGVKSIGEATLDGDTLYVGGDDGALLAFDLGARTVEPRWKFVVKSASGRTSAVTTRCVVAAGLVLFGAADDAVYALPRTK